MYVLWTKPNHVYSWSHSWRFGCARCKGLVICWHSVSFRPDPLFSSCRRRRASRPCWTRSRAPSARSQIQEHSTCIISRTRPGKQLYSDVSQHLKHLPWFVRKLLPVCVVVTCRCVSPWKYSVNNLPYILESNPHHFYSFRGLKNQMRIRFAI
jgi:hypothetical protein